MIIQHKNILVIMRCGIIIWQLGFCIAKYSGSMVITQSYRITVTFSMFWVYLSFMPCTRLHNWSLVIRPRPGDQHDLYCYWDNRIRVNHEQRPGEWKIWTEAVGILLYYYVDEPFFNIFFTYYVTSLQDQIVWIFHIYVLIFSYIS